MDPFRSVGTGGGGPGDGGGGAASAGSSLERELLQIDRSFRDGTMMAFGEAVAGVVTRRFFRARLLPVGT